MEAHVYYVWYKYMYMYMYADSMQQVDIYIYIYIYIPVDIYMYIYRCRLDVVTVSSSVPADGQLAIYGGCEAVHVSLFVWPGADRGALRYVTPPSLPPSPTSHWHPHPPHTHTEEQLSAVDSLISSMDLMAADM